MLTLDRIIDNVGNRVGNLANGDTTDDTRLALTGKGEAGKIVEVHDGDTLLGTATVADNGYWLFHTDWLDDGQQYAFRAKYAADTDGAGYTDSYVITIDAPYPLSPTTAKFGENSVGSYQNQSAFAALKDNGSVVTWGNATKGGDSTPVAAQLASGVVQVFSSGSAFAALKDDGSVVTWGDAGTGGNSTGVAGQLASGVVQVFSANTAFAALKENGSVVTWGSANGGDSTAVAGQLASGVVQVFTNLEAFAALKDNGSVVTWGHTVNGGNSTAVTEQLTSGVVQVFSNGTAFAALKDDGSVVTWGNPGNGGDSTSSAAHLTSGVVQVFGTGYAFAALKDDGSVVTWGNATNGGNSVGVAAQLTSGVAQVFSNGYAFAALKADGSVVTWGNAGNGGNSASVSTQLNSGVVEVFSTGTAFAALKDDGSVITWGYADGGGNSSPVATELASGIVQVFSNAFAFAALKDDGSVVTWGRATSGGDSTPVTAELTSGVVLVFSTSSAFAALKDDGTVVTWGSAANGGTNDTNVELTGVSTIAHPRGSVTVSFDTSPDAPTLTLVEDTGSDPADGITADATILVSGLESGATWEYSANNGVTWQAGSGTTFELPDGTYIAGQIQVRQTVDGKTSPAGSNGASIVVDTAAPGVPTITSLALTNEATPELTGTAEANSTVKITVGGATYTTTATGGVWSVDLATATPTSGTLALNSNGNNPVSVTATDAAGNASLPGTQTLVIDTTAPAVPTITSNALTNEAAPELTGTAEAGSTVTITVGGATYTTTATGGVWNVDLATATPASGTLALNSNGNNPVSVTATDAAGNTSGAAAQTLVIDTSAPAVPTITSAALTNEAAPELTGTAEAGSTVTITVGGATYTTTATGGVWSVDLATATPASGTLSLSTNGNNPVSVTATDAAGNTSSAAAQTLVIDTTAPFVPTITSPTLTNEANPELTGTAEDNSTVTITVGGATYTTIATGGVWSVDLATATPTSGTLALNSNGNNPVSVTATDAAGNTSSAAAQTLVIDTTAPTVPTITSATLTNEAAPKLTGTAEANSTVTITVAGATYTTTATGDVWRVDLATATPISGTLALNSNGNNPVSVTATDAAGNTSQPGTQTLVIDTTAPAVPTITSDALTNEAAPELTGTAEAGSTVTVFVAGATYTTTATGGVWRIDLATATPTSGTLAPNSNGNNPVSVTATDAAGNVSLPGTQTLVIDTTAPGAPTITSDALTNEAAPELTGTAAAGSTVTITVGGATYEVIATATGTWSVDLETATPVNGTLSLNANGNNPVTVTATDAAGNVSLPGTQSLVIDTTAPAVPTITSAALTNEAAPELTGTAEANSTVTVTVGGATYEVVATATGTWSVDPATATPTSGTLALNSNGNNPVTVTATDAAGNTSGAATQTLVIDTTAPAAPTITSEALTNEAAPELTGTAEAGSTVTITVGGATYSTIATGGVWNVDLATATPSSGTLALNTNGNNPVSVIATDAVGNTSTATEQTLVIDTTAPAVPTISSLALTNEAAPELTGTAEAGSTVTVTVSGATYEVVATAAGTWNVDLEAATPTSGTLALNSNGNNPVSVTATDAAGNTSGAAEQTLVIDTTAPAVPTITSNALTNQAAPELTGTAEAGSTVTVTVAGATYEVVATAAGTWKLDLATATPTSGTLALNSNGNNPVSATATDAAGNTSNAAAQTLVIDTTAPAVPTITSDALANEAAPELTGRAEAGSTVTVTVGNATYTVQADADGDWFVDLATATPDVGTGPLALNDNGSNPVSVTATDAAGNTSGAAAQTLVIDTTAPAVPTITSDALTNEAAPELTGTAEANSTVTVTVAGATYTVQADADGDWRLDLETATPASGTLALDGNGNNPVSVTATDAAGNTSSAAAQTLVIDTTAPVVPTITSPALTNEAAPELMGSAEANSTVTVTVAGATYTVQVNADGDWRLDLETATPASGTLTLNDNGSNAVSVTATDAAGNTSTAAEQTLVIDTTAPAVPTITSDALTNEAMPELTGTAEANSTVTVTAGNAKYTVQADADGDWAVDLATATPDVGTGPLDLHDNGDNPVTVTATDAAGNTSGAAEQTLVIDTTAPAVPTITSDALTNEATPELTGTAEAGSKVTVTVAGATYEVIATAAGTWKLALAITTPVNGTLALNSNGNNPVSVTATDAAGNVSLPATQALTIDTTPPAAPTLSFASDASTWVVTVVNLEPGATWQYQLAGEGWVTSQGSSFTLPLGAYPAGAIQVRQIDAAGNLGAALGSAALTPPATDLDGDGLDDNIENGVPGMDGGQQGDGNGDGIPDAEQPDVTSLIWVQTPDEQVRYVTLVNNAGLVQQAVSTAPIDATTLPEALTLPLGELAFTVRDLPESGIVTFSVFIDDDIPVNGYWKQIDGQWINIATAIEAVGGKIRIDFQIEDGGRFDADGVHNGVIVDSGAPGWFDGDPLDTDGDQVPDLLEWGLGLTPGVTDNDVFARDDLFVMQVYRDALGREADAGGLDYWVDGLGGGLTRAAFLTQIWASDEALATEPLAHLAVGLLARAPETAEWAAWRDGLAQGQTTAALADAFVLAHYDQAADAAFIDQLYADALSREADAGGRDYWVKALADGTSRGFVALQFVQSDEAVQVQGRDLDVTLLYTGLLGRGADAEGLAYWGEALANGASLGEVAIAIVGSTEYHDRLLPSQEDIVAG